MTRTDTRVAPTSRRGLALLLAPALILYALVVLVPLIGTVGLSLVHWDGYSTPRWGGIDNFARAVRDTVFLASFWHALIYIAATLVLEVLVGLCLAGWISAHRHTGFYRVALFVPVMLPMVAVAVLWTTVFNADFGLLNNLLGDVGLAGWQRVWLGDAHTALLSLSVVSGWVYSGFYMAIFLAALNRVPREIMESARLDGASPFVAFRRIQVPLIAQMRSVAILLCVTGGIQVFDLFYVMTGGGPYHLTEVPTTYLVQTVFQDSEIGYGSAMAVLLTVLGLAVAALLTVRRNPGTSLDY